MISQASVLRPPQAIAELAQRRPTGGVLSVFLDTSPGQVLGRAYVMSFIDGCKAVRAGLPPAERADFEAAVTQAGRYLAAEFAPKGLGTALFASGRDEYFFVVPLPYRPSDTVSWGDTPRLDPLRALVDDAERVAVLLFDKERARLFTVFLGAIEEEQEITDEVPGKQATGGWFGLAQARYARHHEDHVWRHAHAATAALMELLQRRPFDRLFLAGPDEALALLDEALPGPLRSRFVGVLRLELFASDAEVLAATLPAAEQVERRVEAAEVAELLEATGSPHVALGLNETLAALNDGRVHLLFLADTFRLPGGRSLADGRLVPSDTPDIWGAGPNEPIADLREAVVSAALAQGARIEHVAGPAAAALAPYGGIGAWTRY